MNDQTRKPRFQQPARPTFQERIVGEKSPQNRPHFERKRQTPRPFAADNTAQSEPTRRELSLNKAGKTGSVNVWVKSRRDEPKVKKNGPLSPRAPEKIKRNRAEEMKVYGEAACLAVFAERPQSIVRAWVTVQASHKTGELLSYLAAHKKAYHVVDSEELALVSGSEHHGGLCLLVKKTPPLTLNGYLAQSVRQDCLLLLYRLRNPQNIGGVVRTAAVFGVKNLIVEQATLDDCYSPAAFRVAEGGMEKIRLLETDDAPQALERLRQAGYQIVHCSTEKHAKSLNQLHFSEKTVLVVSDSNAEFLAETGDDSVTLHATGYIQNGLNTAVRTGILLAKWYYR